MQHRCLASHSCSLMSRLCLALMEVLISACELLLRALSKLCSQHKASKRSIRISEQEHCFWCSCSIIPDVSRVELRIFAASGSTEVANKLRIRQDDEGTFNSGIGAQRLADTGSMPWTGSQVRLAPPQKTYLPSPQKQTVAPTAHQLYRYTHRQDTNSLHKPLESLCGIPCRCKPHSLFQTISHALEPLHNNITASAQEGASCNTRYRLSRNFVWLLSLARRLGPWIPENQRSVTAEALHRCPVGLELVNWCQTVLLSVASQLPLLLASEPSHCSIQDQECAGLLDLNAAIGELVFITSCFVGR